MWATIIIVAGLFSACSDAEFAGGPDVGGSQVYFPDNVATAQSIGSDVSSITIPVLRINKEAALNLPILANDESGLFTIPTSVAFAAGQEKADLLITFDRTKLEDGKEYPLALLINDEANTTPYGNRTLNLMVMPWPWELMGKGKFRDDWFCSMYKGGNPEIEVNIHKHKSKEGIYMIENMYGWPFLTSFFGAPQEDIGGLVTYTPTDITIDCSDPAKVFIPRQFTGITDLDPNYGKFEITTSKTGNGTLANGIITFPKEGLAFVYNGTKMVKANKGGLFRIVLPGSEATDYSLSVEYGGMKVGADNETTSAVINFEYGADVQGVSYVFAEGDLTATAAEVAAKIAAGTAENVQELPDFVVGAKQVAIEAQLKKAAIYTIIAVPKDKKKVLLAAEVFAVKFFFPGMGSTIPECDVKVELKLVSEVDPALLDKYPDYSSLAVMISGTNLSEGKYYVNTTETIAKIKDGSLGVSLAEAIAKYGYAFSEKQLAKINKDGRWTGYMGERKSATSYTMIVEAKNTYGKSALVESQPQATAEVPYSGDLAIGKYAMRYEADKDNIFENQFELKPTLNSTTAFVVYDIGFEDGSKWIATYDPAASTLTLDGTVLGADDPSQNYFGILYGYWDAAKTQGYGFFSYASPESQGKDPLVITVASNQLSMLNTDLVVSVFDLESGKSIGSAGYYPANTPITKAAASASFATPAKAKIQRSWSANIPFSSIRVPANAKSVRDKLLRQRDATVINAYNNAVPQLRTLNVKTAKCAPLPKQIVRCTDFNQATVNHLIMK